LSLVKRINNSIRDVIDFPKVGITFKDITPILKDPVLSSDLTDEIVKGLPLNITHVAGIESRGFLFGFPVAIKNKTPFILIRKKGKLPYKTVSLKYALEYGDAEIEMHIDSVGPGDKVVVHDDLLATGGTACAAAELIKSQGADVIGFSFVVELSFLNGRELLLKHSSSINSLVEY
jgi:adenine phosphoribosyltransferase